MFLIDTNVISEFRKQQKANAGVLSFFARAAVDSAPLFLSAITIGELRRGIELVRHRGDSAQAAVLEAWLRGIVEQYGERILPFDGDAAQVWGRLRVPDSTRELDKQIAAIALTNGLTIVTRNRPDFHGTGAPVVNPFVP